MSEQSDKILFRFFLVLFISFLGLSLAFGSGRYASQLAGLLGPAAASPLWSGLRPLLRIAHPLI